MLIVLNVIFIALWSTISIVFGFLKLREILGGTIWFFYMLPFLFSFSLYSKDYAKITWSIASTFIGIVIVNYLHSYFIIHNFNFGTIVLTYLIYIPFCLIFFGCYLSIQTFLIPVSSNEIENHEDMDKFRHFMGYFFLMTLLTIGLAMPLAIYLGSYRNVNSIAFEISSIIFAIGMLLILFESRNISKETINYFAKPIPRINFNARKALKLITIGTFMFIIFSAIDELTSRGHWLMWFGSVAIIVTNISLLCKFGQIIFLPINNQRERPNNFYLPAVKNKIFIIFALLMLFFLVITCLIASR